MTAERWLPIPAHEGYEISDHGNVRTVNHLVVRSNGIRYTVAERIRRIGVDHRCGLRYVKLATGRRGRYDTVYIHRLMADVFGETAPANINPPPANSSKLQRMVTVTMVTDYLCRSGGRGKS